MTSVSADLVVASGYGLKIRVWRGHLVVEDGVGSERRSRKLARATCGLRRLVVVGHTGYVTLEALRWVRDVGATFIQIDSDGQLVSLTAPQSTDRSRLRRAQALAAYNDVGLGLARELLRDKIAGQASVLDELPADAMARADMNRARRDIDQAPDFDGLVGAEARAACIYWDAWATVPVSFGKADITQVPAHWLTFGQRHSTLTSSPRAAINPANAILNYLYALLEAETTIALQTVGVDPNLGLFHSDRDGRASLSLDVMEAVRPAVDAYLLALLRQRRLSASYFVETRRGECRLLPELATELAGTTGTWAALVASVAERVAQVFATSADLGRQPTPLTKGSHVAAWESRRSRPSERRNTAPRLPMVCSDCGGPLPNRRRQLCEFCRRQRATTTIAQARPTAAKVLAELREQGRDPAHGGNAGASRAAKNARHQRAVIAWERSGAARADPATFRQEIWPRLRRATNAELMALTGLSEHYCSLIRLGKRVPHPRHWDTLALACAEA